MSFHPSSWQTLGADWLLRRLTGAARELPDVTAGGLLFDPGLRKTSTTLMALTTLKMFGEVRRTLIAAPPYVCRITWPDEIKRHGFDFTWAVAMGTPKQRLAALNSDAEIVIINRENIPWLAKQQFRPFDAMIVDESYDYKNWGAKRSKAARHLAPQIPRRVILTGDPIANGEADLHAQIFLLDLGRTLGKTVTYFRQMYMRQGGYLGREWALREGVGSSIMEAVAPLVLRLNAEDHLDLPPLLKNPVWVELPPVILKAYKQVERELFAALDNGETLEASGAGAKYALCRSIANGGAYVGEKDDRRAIHVHDAKLEAVAGLLGQLGNRPVMLPYIFDHDLARLRSLLPKAPCIKGKAKRAGSEPGPTPAQVREIVDEWNAGKSNRLLCQPQAMATGLNLQDGGCNDLVWFGPTNMPVIDHQTNCRIHRSGAKGQIRAHYVLARNTVDESIYAALQEKGANQKTMLDQLVAYRKRQSQTYGVAA